MSDENKNKRSGALLFWIFQAQPWNGNSDSSKMRSGSSSDGKNNIRAHFENKSVNFKSSSWHFNRESFHRIGFDFRKSTRFCQLRFILLRPLRFRNFGEKNKWMWWWGRDGEDSLIPAPHLLKGSPLHTLLESPNNSLGKLSVVDVCVHFYDLNPGV